MRKDELRVLKAQVKASQDWMRRALVLAEMLRKRGADTRHIFDMKGVELEIYMLRELNMAKPIGGVNGGSIDKE